MFTLILYLSETVFVEPEVLYPQDNVVVVEVGKHDFSKFIMQVLIM